MPRHVQRALEKKSPARRVFPGMCRARKSVRAKGSKERSPEWDANGGRGRDRSRSHRLGPSGQSAAQQGNGIQRGRARYLRAARLSAAPHRHARRADQPSAGGAALAGNRLRALCLPARAAGCQRDPVLRAAHAASAGDAADRLHAHGRRRLPALQPNLVEAARSFSELAASRSDQGDSRPSALRQDRDDRGQRRRAHSRSRRPGRGRHGHPDRQARALHRLRRVAPGDDLADPARYRHRQPRTPRRPALYRLAP